jgi:NitT/TauT family transport system permease protein
MIDPMPETDKEQTPAKAGESQAIPWPQYAVFACGVLSAISTVARLYLVLIRGAPASIAPVSESSDFLQLLKYASPVLGIAAWVLGNQTLKQVTKGGADSQVATFVRLGRRIGIAVVVIWILWEAVLLWRYGPTLLKFLIVALAFVSLLTLVVRLARLRVNEDMAYAKGVGLTTIFIGLIVAAWWVITHGSPGERLVQPLILPSPAEVLKAFGPLHFEQGLVRSALYSWLRVTAGFGLAALVAIPLGLYMASFPQIAAFFRPLSLAGAYVPIVVFIPLSMTWFGLGEPQKIGFLFIACFVALLPLVIKDIADVPSAFLDVAVTKGASQWQLVRHVLFPVAKANIWDHLRGVYGVGWGWIIMAEILVLPEYGLGGLIEVSNRRSQTGSIFAIIIVIVLIAIVCDRLWKLGGDLLFPYRKRE